MRFAAALAVSPALALLASCASMQGTSGSEPSSDREMTTAFITAQERERQNLEAADRLLRAAEQHIRNSEFGRAMDELEEARRLAPGSREIRATYNEVSRILGFRPADWCDGARELTAVELTELGIRFAETEFVRLESEADGLMRQEEYSAAAAVYHAAAAGLEACPVLDFKLNDCLHRARERRAEALRLMRRD